MAASEAVIASDSIPSSSSSMSSPFAFLSEPEAPAAASADGSFPAVTTTSSSSNNKKPQFGRLFQSVASKTTQSLERGLHTLAKKAGPAISKPDALVMVCEGSATELQPHPTISSTTLSGNVTSFSLPISVISRSTTTTTTQQSTCSVSLYLKSGVSGKAFLIGSCILPLPSSVSKAVSFQSIPWQSSIVAGSMLYVWMVPDNKLPPLCGRGWSLADPLWNQQPPPNSPVSSFYNVPLDQSYAYTFQEQGQLLSRLVATERAIESTVVVPIAAAWAKHVQAASLKSLHQTKEKINQLQYLKHDSIHENGGDYVHVECQIQSLQLSPDFRNLKAATPPMVSVAWQRPDCIFEVDLVAPTAVSTTASPQNTIPFKFFPKPTFPDKCLPSLKHILQQQQHQIGYMLGSLRVQVILSARSSSSSADPMMAGSSSNSFVVENPFAASKSTTMTASEATEVWQGFLPLEPLLLQPTSHQQVFSIPLYYTQGGNQPTGSHLVMSVSLLRQRNIRTSVGPTVTAAASATEGLLSLVGLPPLVFPMISLEYNENEPEGFVGMNGIGAAAANSTIEQQRRLQLATMGQFVTSKYLQQHLETIRMPDVQLLQERGTSYENAIATVIAPATGRSNSIIEPHKTKTPRPFRPSSSRIEVGLSGIPFNVHTASWSLQVLDPSQTNGISSNGQQQSLGDAFYNITCGAPADHARGFGNIFASGKDGDYSTSGGANLASPVGPFSGGLRRLETKRKELADHVNQLQSELITTVGSFFASTRQSNQQAPQVYHVPARYGHIHQLRCKIAEGIHALHHVSWTCAMRRASVFSQALGVATTAYLASLSDPAKCHSTWPDIWMKHGYLVSFEGLLSAAGKELGMIEDASVAIDMLRMVEVVLVRDDGQSMSTRVPIPGSPYLKWLALTANGSACNRQFTLQIAMIPSYFDQRIPPSMKNAPVRFVSLLFEVGVDIRQWGANAVGSSMKTQSDEKQAPVGLIDDEDDDVGISDEDELVQMNYEALQKLNAYAYLLSPTSSSPNQQKTHPLMETLHQHVVNSAGKINHDILDEAAQLAQQLGGSGVVFCKSGKDRTAMHVTYKQAQFLNRFRERHPSADPNIAFVNTTLDDAALLRIYGTRLPICEKNVGQAKYAFNMLQVKFMPDALKPPASTLAGFLKGGKVFGGIES